MAKQGMTVGELIELLGDEDPDAPVMFTWSTGDYWGTVAAASPKHVNNARVKWNDRIREYSIVDEDSSDYQNSAEVVILE